MESCSLPSSSSYFAEIGVPSLALAVSPRSSGILASLSAAASFGSSLVSDASIQPTGVASRHDRNKVDIVTRVLMALPPGFEGPSLKRRNERSSLVIIDTPEVKRYTPEKYRGEETDGGGQSNPTHPDSRSGALLPPPRAAR